MAHMADQVRPKRLAGRHYRNLLSDMKADSRRLSRAASAPESRARTAFGHEAESFRLSENGFETVSCQQHVQTIPDLIQAAEYPRALAGIAMMSGGPASLLDKRPSFLCAR